MGILSGALTVRRFRVVGEVREGFRETYRDALNNYAFMQPPNGIGKEKVEGWVRVHNLLDTDFSDLNEWLYDPYAIFCFREDKKTLPARLFKATLEKQAEAWCAERGVDSCPPGILSSLRDELERKWLKRVLPSTAVTEVCWEMNKGFALVHTTSENRLDRIRKRFFQTFGLQLVAWSPLDWLESKEAAQTLMSTAPMGAGGEA